MPSRYKYTSLTGCDPNKTNPETRTKERTGGCTDAKTPIRISDDYAKPTDIGFNNN